MAWLLFSAGGMVAALLVPVLLLLFGVVFPLGCVGRPITPTCCACCAIRSTRLACSSLCVLSLLHWAHRFRYTLYDGLHSSGSARPISLLCYGGALAGSLWAAVVLFQ